MNNRKAKMENSDSFLDKYIMAAVNHRKATFDGDYKVANSEASRLTKLYRELEGDQKSAGLLLKELFNHPNASVKGWAAAHALGLRLNTDQAILVLQQLSDDDTLGPIRLDAEMTLREWRRKGRLRF